MKFLKVRSTIFTTLIAASSFAWSWDGAVTTSIQNVEVGLANDYGFRVLLKDYPTMCGNAHSWAYLNESDSNYRTYVSVLLAAKMSGATVTIYSNRETVSGNGYCHIGYVVLR